MQSCTVTTATGTRERNLAPTELNELSTWISNNNIDRLPKFDEGAADGIQYEYFHVVRNGPEHRVFMNNPPGAPIGAGAVFFGDKSAPNRRIYGELTKRLIKLGETPMPVIYNSLKNLSGFKVVHAREKGQVTTLSYRDNRLIAAIWSSKNNQQLWYSVNDSGLSEEPLIMPDASDRKSDSDYLNDIDITHGPLAGKHLLISWTTGKEGLWIANNNTKSELLARGIFGQQPVISSDGNWIVAAKTKEGCMWDVPNGVVRIHVQSKRVFPVDLPPADNFDPLAWINAHKKVLLYQQRDRDHWKAGPVEREFYLLDPMTGVHQKVEGDFRPLFFSFQQYHALQPSTSPNQVWAVLPEPENEKNGTTIGLYDTRLFGFTPIVQLPSVITFGSGMWVDESARVVWLAENGDLLRFSLPAH